MCDTRIAQEFPDKTEAKWTRDKETERTARCEIAALSDFTT